MSLSTFSIKCISRLKSLHGLFLKAFVILKHLFHKRTNHLFIWNTIFKLITSQCFNIKITKSYIQNIYNGNFLKYHYKAGWWLLNLKSVTSLLYKKYPNTDFFSGLYFHVFGLNTEIYSVTLRIQSKYGKIRTRKNSVLGLFLHSASRVL